VVRVQKRSLASPFATLNLLMHVGYRTKDGKSWPYPLENREILDRLFSTGLSRATCGDIPAATEIFRQISCLQLQNISDFRQAGTLASLIGQHKMAAKIILAAIDMTPNNRALWIDLGNIHSNAGNLEQGLETYNNALDIDPDLALPGLAQVYDVLGMHNRADNELARIAERRFNGSSSNSSHDNPPALLFAFLPKSAGTSLCRAIEQCTGITQGGTVATTDRNHFPNARISREAFSSSIQNPVQLHTHISATERNLKILNESSIERLPVHVRDPRQAFVSYYFHSRNAMELARNRYANPGFNKLDEQGGFQWFMDFYYPRFIDWITGWVRTENNICRYSFSLQITTFEDMLKLGQTRIVKNICDFYGMAPELPPVEQKHRLRKGLVDEWRSVIPDTYHAALSDMIPPELMERFSWKH